MKNRKLLLKILTLTFVITEINSANFTYAKNLMHGKFYDSYINLSEEKYPEELKKWYKEMTGEQLDLINPKTYCEKIQWLKIHDSTALKTKLADKYEVREWVKNKIGNQYLVPILGVWDRFEDINFDLLPNKFILKATHGSGWNILVTNKKYFMEHEKNLAKNKFDKWLNTNFAFLNGFELHYKNIKPRIVAEKYLDFQDNKPLEYKITCIDGNPQIIRLIYDRFGKAVRKHFDVNWNFYPLNKDDTNLDEIGKKPDNLEEIFEIAKKLSKGFPIVRVDLYRLKDNSLLFGEMTFTPESGLTKFPSSSKIDFQTLLGSKINIENIRKGGEKNNE